MKYQHSMIQGQSSYPKDEVLISGSSRSEEREHLRKKNNEAKREPLKLSKIYVTPHVLKMLIIIIKLLIKS
jgi:hypothetical protein